MRAIQLKEKLDAGVDRAIAQRAVLMTADQHRTRAAVAFLAHDLRSRGALVVAKEARERLKRARVADAVRNAVDVEQEMVAHPSGR